LQSNDYYIIIQNWFIKSEEALKDAEIAINNERFSTAQNRIYYAIFYSVMALAYSKNFTTAKHSQLLGWFNRNYIKEGVFAKSLGDAYINAYNSRMKSDYTYTYKPDKDKINSLFKDAQIFVKAVQDYIKD